VAKDFELPIDAGLLKQLQEEDALPGQLLKSMFDDKAAHASLCQALASYFYDNGGSPEVRTFDIVEATFNSNNIRGSFKCDFTVNYFFTCSDIKNQKTENITWKFKVDSSNLKINFIGEEPWVWE
jgi:hypothetical protein